MAIHPSLRVDQAELNEAVQSLKVAIDQFLQAKIWLVADPGDERLHAASIQQIAKQNPEIGAILQAAIDLTMALGGELVATEPEETSLGELGYCGATQWGPQGDLLCALKRDHEGLHSWE